MSFLLAGGNLVDSRPFLLHSDPFQLIAQAALSIPVDTEIAAVNLPCNEGIIFFSEDGPTNLAAISWYRAAEAYEVDNSNLHLTGWCYMNSTLIPIWSQPLNESFSVNVPASNGETDPLNDSIKAAIPFMTAFWVFVNQRVPALSIERGSLLRASRRRAERAGVNTELLIIDLRRRETKHSDNPEENETQWTHRWITSGHWRNQWYSSTQSHKLKWIDEYVKGPDHLPLIVKDKVFNVVH